MWNVEETKRMIFAVSEELIANEKYLCELDSYIGDGDHGATVARGFTEVKKLLVSEESGSDTYSCPADVLKKTGHTLSISMGGAMGPLLGGFFQAGVRRIGETAELGEIQIQILLEEGLRRIQLLGNAKEGERTLVDALAPACRAVADIMKTPEPGLKEVLKVASEAAEKGAENTKTMQAKKGRASFLGEKSVGYVDAGATTMALIIQTMYRYAAEGESA